MPRTVLTPPAGGSPMPDIPNWAWHEYGNRVGFWRMLEVFDEFRIPAALAINGSAIAAYEPIARAARERNWEFMGHGFTQKNMQKVEDEAADIARTTEAIAGFTGRRPRGWLGPGPDGDLGDARPAGGSRLRVRLRLGARRPAGGAQDARGADRQRALHAGMQRRGDDADPAPQGIRVRRPRHRPVRAAPRTTPATPRASWRSSCTPTSWARRIASNISARRSSTFTARGDVCSGPASRSSTGIRPSAGVGARPRSSLPDPMPSSVELDLIVSPQLLRAGGIDHLALAHHVHVVDELEGERGVLLDEQDGEALLLQLADRLPNALDDDRARALRTARP